jgi:hypothetical protein
MLFQCPKCQKIDFDSYCFNCKLDKILYANANEIVITISDFSVGVAARMVRRSVPNSLSNQNNNTSYQLKPDELSVPVEQLKSSLEETKPHSVSMRGAFIHGKTDEQKVWSGTPHPLVVSIVVFKWIPIIVTAFVLKSLFKVNSFWLVLLLILAFSHIVLSLIALVLIRYRISSQRVEITDGLLHQQIRTYEVHNLGDATIDIPFPLGLFGLSMLTLRHRYGIFEKTLPLVRIFHRLPSNEIPSEITLVGLRKEEARLIRDILRNSGQIEAARFDKFRVRND